MKRFATAFLWRFLLLHLLITALVCAVVNGHILLPLFLFWQNGMQWVQLILQLLRYALIGTGVFGAAYISLRIMPKNTTAPCKRPTAFLLLVGFLATVAEYGLILPTGITFYSWQSFAGLTNIARALMEIYLSDGDLYTFPHRKIVLFVLIIPILLSLAVFCSFLPILRREHNKRFGNYAGAPCKPSYWSRFLRCFVPRFLWTEAAAALVSLGGSWAANRLLRLQSEHAYRLLIGSQFLLGTVAIVSALHFAYRRLAEKDVFPEHPRVFLMTFAFALWFVLAVLAMQRPIQEAMCSAGGALLHLESVSMSIVHNTAVVGCLTECLLVLIAVWTISGRYEED